MGRATRGPGPYDQALHLVFAQHLDAQSLADLVVELEGAAARGHDTQLVGGGAIELLVVGLQLAHEGYARVYTVGLELDKVEAATERALVGLTREIDEFGERASNRDDGSATGGSSAWYARDRKPTSTATWLTTAVWLGRRMSLVSWS